MTPNGKIESGRRVRERETMLVSHAIEKNAREGRSWHKRKVKPSVAKVKRIIKG